MVAGWLLAGCWLVACRLLVGCWSVVGGMLVSCLVGCLLVVGDYWCSAARRARARRLVGVWVAGFCEVAGWLLQAFGWALVAQSAPSSQGAIPAEWDV